MSVRNLILCVHSVAVPYLIHCDSLLKNAIDIVTKCDSYFITKCDRSLSQNVSGFLLQIATVLLQNATNITNCDVCYKLWQCNKLYNTFLISSSVFMINRFQKLKLQLNSKTIRALGLLKVLQNHQKRNKSLMKNS